MAWQVIERNVMRSTSPSITISKLGRLNFNGAATKVLHDGNTESVLLLWDADARKIGIQRVGKRDPRSYTVRYARKNAWSGFAAKTFLERINYDYSKTVSYPAEWDKTEEMFVFSLPSVPARQEPQHAQPKPERARPYTRGHSETGIKAKASGSI
jgi:hypothetical protein